MGRAGSGSGGHSHSHSHSHSSSSHRTSSHRPSSSGGSHRAGSGSRSSHSSYGGSHRSMGSYNRIYFTNNHSSRSGGYYGGGYGRSTSGADILITIAVMMIIAAIIIACAHIMTAAKTPKSTITRTKISTGAVWDSDCIIDEINWFDSPGRCSARLKDFFDKTGIQPVIYLRAYDSSLGSDSAKEQWADDYFESAGYESNVMLFTYFAEYDTDNDVGLMTVSFGGEAGSLMDAEAEDIFWNYIDRYWYTDMSTDDVFVSAFNDTAKAIMSVSKTGFDIMWLIIVGIIVIAVVFIIIAGVVRKQKLATQQAQADAQILNSDLTHINSPSSATEDRYLNNQQR